EVDGQRYSHILDPRSGMPAQGLRSLTVVHSDGTLAEAGGAALFVAGRDKWPLLARKLGLSQVLAQTDDGEVQVSPVLAARLQADNNTRLQIVS
ncbi:MAG: FAD:protein FMN transferase, partial [Panacagrimonas sp.]